MSKFNNPERTLGVRPAPWAMTQPVVHGVHFEPSKAAPETPAVISQDRSFMTPVGYALLCALLLSGYLNDWSLRLLGGKAYLSTVCIVLVPAVWLISGNALSGFRDRVGFWWLMLVGLMVLGVPFSYYRSESLSEIWTYIFRSLSYFFYVVTFATTLRRVRNLMLISVICEVIVVITCVTFGSVGADTDTRFRIADSLFLSNSNLLALQLLLGITAFMFLFYMRGTWKKILGIVGILGSFIYMLRTGSRGCLLSAVVLFLVMLFVSRRRFQMLAVTIPVLAVALAIIPSESLHRFTLIFQQDPSQPMDTNEVAAAGSMAERQVLLRKGLEFTFTHPLVGVGMGQFAAAYTGEAEKEGKHAPWLGTHNSYTEISSECGIPAFICYMAVIVLSFRRTYGVYVKAVNQPQYRELEGLAVCLLSGLLVYSIATFFFHMAYTDVLPLLSGQAVALARVAKPYFTGSDAPQAAAPILTT